MYMHIVQVLSKNPEQHIIIIGDLLFHCALLSSKALDWV